MPWYTQWKWSIWRWRDSSELFWGYMQQHKMLLHCAQYLQYVECMLDVGALCDNRGPSPKWERVSENEKEEGERWGNSILLQLIFFKYFTWILAAVVLQKTKGNEPWLLEPKTTHSVRKSRHSYCLEHRERQSQSKLLKSALGYMKHIGKKISWWKNICDVAGGKWSCRGEHPCKK